MANNNLVARLDNENIVIVDEINDHAVGEKSGIFDETTDTLYPFGGGGDTLHHCAITIRCDSSLIPITDYEFGITLNNGLLTPIYNIPNGETTENFLYVDFGNDFIQAIYSLNYADFTITPSDAVNCEYIAGSDPTLGSAVVVTDPTLDSSITLTFIGK